MTYVQCDLRQENVMLTTWIPKEKGVGKGARLTLKGEEGIWTVDKTYSEATEEQVLLQRDLYRTHRKATDI